MVKRFINGFVAEFIDWLQSLLWFRDSAGKLEHNAQSYPARVAGVVTPPRRGERIHFGSHRFSFFPVPRRSTSLQED